MVKLKNSKNITFNFNFYITHYNATNIFNPYDDNNVWRTATGQDANSTSITTKLTDGKTETIFYNNTKQKIRFNLGKSVFIDVLGNNVTDRFSLKPFTSKILIGKNFENINQSPSIPDQSFNIISPKYLNDSK
jgi:hypothetical protein